VESLATGVIEAGLAIGRYRYSWLTDRHWPGTPPSTVTDLTTASPKTPGGVRGRAVNDPVQVIGFGIAVLVGIYHQRGYLLTPRSTS
jgi:hypothetical protein